jgi:hypothetical protein
MITYKMYFAVVTVVIAVLTALVQFNVIAIDIDKVTQVGGLIWSVLVALGLAVDKIQSDNPSPTVLKVFKPVHKKGK